MKHGVKFDVLSAYDISNDVLEIRIIVSLPDRQIYVPFYKNSDEPPVLSETEIAKALASIAEKIAHHE